MGFAAMCSLVLIYFIVYDVVEPILKDQVPENRFYLMSLLFRVLVPTFSGKRSLKRFCIFYHLIIIVFNYRA